VCISTSLLLRKSGLSLPSDRLSYDFLKMFGVASLRVLSSRRVEIPIGNYCDLYTGIDGTSRALSQYKAISVKNFVQLLDMMSKSMIKDGGLELANGTIISSENERQALMEDIAHFVSEGVSGIISEWVVKQPF
jgi:hypothetical protein